jgi:glutaredoxin
MRVASDASRLNVPEEVSVMGTAGQNAARRSRSPQAQVYRMVMDEHLCPFGVKAKALLQRRGFEVEDHHLSSRSETDAFKEAQGVETTPQVFVEGRRIGGYDSLREFFGLRVKSDEGVSYQPVIATLGTALSLSIAVNFATLGQIASQRVLEWFVAFSMCLLASLKLQDLESFSNQFLGYDLLAQRKVRYAYVYPFVELIAGVGMLAGVLVPLMSVGALFIGTVGALSVIKAVYIDHRELKCACVGGNSKVPLGFVSLTENLMMIGIALWMLTKALF